MILKNGKKVSLDHRANFLGYAPYQSLFIAASEKGEISSFHHDLQVTEIKQPFLKMRGIAVHPTKPLLATIDGTSGKIIVQDFDKLLHFEKAPPQVQDGTPYWASYGFLDCFFDENGNYLWCVASCSIKNVEIQLYETNSWLLTDRIFVPDPFGGSSCSFYRAGKPDEVALWVAAGQNGTQVYWLRKTSHDLDCVLEPGLKNTTPPLFSPKRDEYLVVDERNTVVRYDYPLVRRIGQCRWIEDDSEKFSVYSCYLNADYALVSSFSGQLYILNVEAMAIKEKVHLSDGEPSNLFFFERLGDTIILVYRQRDSGIGLDGWQDTLLCFNVNEILGGT